MISFPSVTLRLPDWVGATLDDLGTVFPTVEDRMRVVVELSRLNVVHGTGGPFGAGIFEIGTGRLVAPGVNLVVPASAAVAHAEIVAVAIAGAAVGSFDLGGDGMPPMSLVASTEPCAMCFGAVPWSGVRRLVCAARDSDARQVGFDEGPKMIDWQSALESRGIEVVRDVLRPEAVAVLAAYAAAGGPIYNGRAGE
jgi:tRNA(Arg) A34 adenosine deaminase TadA